MSLELLVIPESKPSKSPGVMLEGLRAQTKMVSINKKQGTLDIRRVIKIQTHHLSLILCNFISAFTMILKKLIHPHYLPFC